MQHVSKYFQLGVLSVYGCALSAFKSSQQNLLVMLNDEIEEKKISGLTVRNGGKCVIQNTF